MSVIFLVLFFQYILGQERICTTSNPCNNEFIFEDNIGKLECLGDESCFNSSIIINPDDEAEQTVEIICQGISACELSSINASNETLAEISGVTSFLCSGNRACFDTHLLLYCEPQSGCDVDCIGEESCADIGDGFFDPSFIIGANKYTCHGNRSCANWGFQADYTIENKVVTFDINGPAAFRESMIFVSGPPFSTFPGTINWNCYGMEACSLIQGNLFFSDINIICGPNACKGNIIEQADTRFILFDANGQIKCDGINACHGLYILNFDANDFNLGGSWDSVECIGESSCQDAIFLTQCNFVTGCNIICNGINSCKNFMVGGLYGVSLFECDGMNACSKIKAPIGLRDDFLIKCGPSSCVHGYFEFFVDPDGLASEIPTGIGDFNIEVPTDELPVSTIKGIECSGANSCAFSTFKFIIFSNIGDTSVETITCGDDTSCLNTTFIFESANTTNNTWDIDVDTVFNCNGFCDTIKAIVINGEQILTSNLIGFNVNEEEPDNKPPKQKDFIGAIIAGGLSSIVIIVGILVLIYKCISTRKSNNEVTSHANVVNHNQNGLTTINTCTTLSTQIGLCDGVKTTV